MQRGRAAAPEAAARDSQGVHLSAAITVAESQADPLHGAARNAGALPRQLRRGAVDVSQSAAADGHLRVHFWRSLEDKLSKRPLRHRLCALFLGGYAAMARVFRSRGPLAVRHPGVT